jgi:hypothetical protein
LKCAILRRYHSTRITPLLPPHSAETASILATDVVEKRPQKSVKKARSSMVDSFAACQMIIVFFVVVMMLMVAHHDYMMMMTDDDDACR